MNAPDLQRLQRGDREAWVDAFHWLWPAASGAARVTLEARLPSEVEDVAIAAVEELVEKVPALASIDEFRPLVASIAHNKAVSRLRQHFAAKRGSGRVESPGDQPEDGGEFPEAVAEDSPVAALEQKELAERLGRLLAELTSPQGEVLADYFLRGLSYEEIATERGVAKGSVGVYLKRGLAAMRRIWGRGGKDV
ncbi:MAG TPA: RNA polymerase sigma factor [Dongiaceae bacterium]|nr:RNA polymerase sigma factor [Dongiaceae bacterium]